LAVAATNVDKATANQLQQCLAEHYPRNRSGFPALLNCLGLVQSAVEVGVQAGVHARSFLDGWHGRHLRLVDTWGLPEHSSGQQLYYVDIANTNGLEIRKQHLKQCETRLQEALKSGRAEIVKLDSVAASTTIADEELDFVYLDARHDCVGVSDDIRAWWPKVKKGGIFAGHDFVDGEFPEGDFFWKSALQQTLPGLENKTYVTGETNRYPSFFVIKTAELAELPMQSFQADVLARRLYAQQSRYLKLWRRSSHEDFFPACRDTCGQDCAERAKVFTPSTTAGSTLRPFACRDSEKQPDEQQPESEAAAAPKESSSAICSVEFTIDMNEFHQVCIERCNVTCYQRDELFSAFAENILLA
jgi:hypothetical protein